MGVWLLVKDCGGYYRAPLGGIDLLGVTPGVGSLPRMGLSLSSQVEFR